MGNFDASSEMTMHVVVRGSEKFDVSCEMTMHVVVRGGGEV